MFSKILAFKNLSKISKSILRTQQLTVNSTYSIVQTPRYLHLKTYDKDAGLDSKRKINELSHANEYESEGNQDIISKKTTEANNAKKGKTNLLKSEDDYKSIELLDGKISNDPDLFGNATKEPIQEDEGDILEEEYISRPTRRSKKLRTKEYANMIKEHMNHHRLKDAIEVLEIRMLKEDRAKPENYIYNLLISGCAKAGYTRKAFSLYTKMRQRALKVKESVYTSLFNACANAPSMQDGLTRAIRLRESLLDVGYEFNVKHYNAMIKAFGRWKDVKTAYILADEMRDKKLEIDSETFNFLLQACASDEKNGFRHCLLTWHKMLESGIKPDYYSFNTVLRCVRDCGFGDLDIMEKALKQILKEKSEESIKLTIKENCTNDHAGPNEDNSSENIALNNSSCENSLQIQNETENLGVPNLLASQPHLGSMISLKEVQKPHERFLLLGGLTGFLENMKSYNITPNIQTFTTMLDVIPPTYAAEKLLLTYVRKIGLKADIDFFNILIKKRAMRFDYEGGREVLSMIQTAGLHPDIVTYGVLALGCTTIEHSEELLEIMREHGIRMNIQILGAMLRQGCVRKDFSYICRIMQISLDENVTPNDVFLIHLNKFYLQCARAIDSRHPTTKRKDFKKNHKKFCDKYRLFQEEHGIEGLKLEDAIKKVTERPYSQYKENEVEGVEPLKNEKLARKGKMRKYIKKLKIKNLKDDDPEHTDSKLLLYSTDFNDNEKGSSQNADEQSNENQPIFSKKCNLDNPFRIHNP